MCVCVCARLCAIVVQGGAEDVMTAFDGLLGTMKQTLRFKKVRGEEATISTAQVKDFPVVSNFLYDYMSRVVCTIVLYVLRVLY